MNKVLNAQILEFLGVMKMVDERINEDVLLVFSYVKRMENNRVAKRLYVGEFACSCSVGQLLNSWIDTMKEGKKRFGCQKSKENGVR